MLHAPVLQLDVARMHEIDPRNVENLFGMWTVFSKCANTIPDGKRLENLSWRVWARETLCCPPQPEKTIVPAIDIPLTLKEEVPSLSNSPGSDSDSDSFRSSLENSALGKSRGKEPHLTPRTLEKIITNIHESKNKHELEPLDPEIEAIVISRMSPEKQTSKEQPCSPISDRSELPSLHYKTESSCLSSITANTTTTERDSPHRDSDTSVSSDGLIRSGSVVHGFSPLPSIRSRPCSNTTKNLPIVASKMGAKPPAPKKGAFFTLGGSSEDDEGSFEAHMSYKRHLLEPRKSSLSQSLSKDQQVPQQRKTTSFREVVEQHTIQTGGSPADDNAIASDDEDDESVMDSAVDEDEEDDGWEDEQPEEEKPLNEPLFKRVDSAAHLPTRRSILTAGLTEADRAKGMLNAASKSSPALKRMNRASSQSGPSPPGSPEQEEGMMMRTTGRGIAVPPPTNEHVYAMAHSPRTTRRNMLSTELTESLRKNLLWERQQKNTTVNAFRKREARSMADLQRAAQSAGALPHPQLELLPPRDNTSYNDYFNVTSEYHTKGW